MKVAIHQPNYLPWYGYFYKMSRADVFIILDTAQYTKNGYQNRVMIKTPQGAQWLTQPVKLADGAFRPTNEISFANRNWAKKHQKSIRANYGKARYFNEYFPEFNALFDDVGENLSEVNTKLIKWLADNLRLNCSICLASECPSKLMATERLVELVKWVGGSTYLSGRGGSNYQDESLFEKADIKLEYVEFKPLPYPQLWGEFIPGLSIIDLIFNCGFFSFHIYKKDVI